MARDDNPARSVRPGEDLDEPALRSYLAAHLEGYDGASAAPIEIHQFRSGHSNLTYLLDLGQGREYVLRRPPFGAEEIARGHDMSREWRVLEALQRGRYDRAPRPVLFCEDTDIVGAPFYLMERVEGLILRGPRPEGLEGTPQELAALGETFVETLVELHGLDVEAIGLGDFGHPTGYVQRQIEGWTKRYHKARTDEVPEVERAATWLAENMPQDRGPALIHNDFKYDNMILDPQDHGRVRAVLDWEMATVGDPLMDLGTSLAYWIEADDDPTLRAMEFGPTSLPGSYTRQGLVERYAARSGRDVSDALYYYVYGLFKVAGIGQQIYYRYARGYTTDERFAMFIHAVRALGQQACRAIDAGRVSQLG